MDFEIPAPLYPGTGARWWSSTNTQSLGVAGDEQRGLDRHAVLGVSAAHRRQLGQRDGHCLRRVEPRLPKEGGVEAAQLGHAAPQQHLVHGAVRRAPLRLQLGEAAVAELREVVRVFQPGLVWIAITMFIIIIIKMLTPAPFIVLVWIGKIQELTGALYVINTDPAPS